MSQMHYHPELEDLWDHDHQAAIERNQKGGRVRKGELWVCMSNMTSENPGYYERPVLILEDASWASAAHSYTMSYWEQEVWVLYENKPWCITPSHLGVKVELLP